MGKGADRSASRRRPLTITFLLSRFPFPALGLPGPRLPSCLIIKEEDHRPDLALAGEILPHRHRRVPGRALARQAGPALGDPPEHEALGELRDGAVVLEVRRQRVEPRRDRKSTRLNSSHSQISYAVFCLKKKKKTNTTKDMTRLRL